MQGRGRFFLHFKKSLSRHLRRNLQLRDNARGAVCCGTYTSPTGRPDGSLESPLFQECECRGGVVNPKPNHAAAARHLFFVSLKTVCAAHREHAYSQRPL